MVKWLLSLINDRAVLINRSIETNCLLLALLAKDLHRTWNLKTSSSTVIVNVSLLCMKQLLPNLNLIIQHTLEENVVGRGKKILNNYLKHFFGNLCNLFFVLFLHTTCQQKIHYFSPESLVSWKEARSDLGSRGTCRVLCPCTGVIGGYKQSSGHPGGKRDRSQYRTATHVSFNIIWNTEYLLLC